MNAARDKELVGVLTDELLPYQRKWVDDEARFKIGLWARQTGKDMAAAAEAVADCVSRPAITWAIVASSAESILAALTIAPSAGLLKRSATFSGPVKCWSWRKWALQNR